MSLQTWLAEFYPTPASTATTENAVSHSLQKWLGALPENLLKHGCWNDDGAIREHDGDCNTFLFTDHSCSLCQVYREYGPEEFPVNDNACRKCPLAQADNECSVEKDNAWGQWRERGDPVPMIAALTALE